MKILKPHEVVRKIGLSRVSVWRLERDGKFPARVKLSCNRVGWIESEIEEWIKQRPRVGQEVRHDK